MSDFVKAGVACACTSCIPHELIWLAYFVIGLVLVVTAVDIYHIWRRCNERRDRIASLRKRIKEGKCNGTSVG